MAKYKSDCRILFIFVLPISEKRSKTINHPKELKENGHILAFMCPYLSDEKAKLKHNVKRPPNNAQQQFLTPTTNLKCLSLKLFIKSLQSISCYKYYNF
jgi:hypothetical protein